MPHTDLVPFEIPAAQLDALLDIFPDGDNKDLSEGVRPSFAVVTFRGKVWRVRYKGEDRVVMGPTGEPVPSIVCVLVKSSPAISKLYYAKRFNEGDDAPPDCFSLDGVVPDPAAVSKQSPTCAACPNNVFGSRITETGGKAKACADNRRLAVVPYPDLANEAYGGPMLLRIPPTSLTELARLGDALRQSHLPYQAVVMKISFDYEVAYPKLVFTAVRTLSQDEALIIREHMTSEAVLRMLTEPQPGDETHVDEEAPAAAPAAAAAAPVEAAEPEPAPAEAPKPKPAPAAPAAAPAPKEKPKQEELVGMSLGAPAPKAGNGSGKQSPAQAAKAPAEVAPPELTDLITNLLS